MKKPFNPSHLLLLWIVVGAVLRFTLLDSKPPWTDEFASLVFSLGNSFRPVPIDQVISLDTLLQPLHPHPQAGVQDTVTHLMQESTHPPVFFVLEHLWLKGFPAQDGLVNLWAARALPALFGVAAIPAIYGLGWLAFRSPLVAHLAAALMAVSPYGIFLAQEVRHYTLAILLVIASLSCLSRAVQCWQQRLPVPYWFCLLWVGINSLGVATHYFFVLTVAAEAIGLLVWSWVERRSGKIQPAPATTEPDVPVAQPRGLQQFARWGVVALGSLAGALVWLPAWRSGYSSELTQWIASGDRSPLTLLNPIFQALAAWITMVSLLPVEADSLAIILLAGAIMIAFFVWLIPVLIRGLRWQLQSQGRSMTLLLGGFVLGAIALFFLITYGLGRDLTRGARYNFVYFPAVMLLVAASLAVPIHAQIRLSVPAWLQRWQFRDRSRWLSKSIVLVLLMGLLSGITVVNNLGYRKYYRPDLLVPIVQQTSQAPILIATAHKTHVQTGEMMGIGWQFYRKNISGISPQFLLAHWDDNPQAAAAALDRAIAQQSQAFDLWLVNFEPQPNPQAQFCTADPDRSGGVNGYAYRLYRCKVPNRVLSKTS